MKSRLLLLFFILPFTFVYTQDATSISLEDIWKNYKFFPKRVSGFNFLKDGQHYTKLVDNEIIKHDITSGQQVAKIIQKKDLKSFEIDNIESYKFSQDERKIILETASESIYRRSYKSAAYIYDSEKKTLQLISKLGKIQYPTFSPDGTKVGYVFENNLYYLNLTNNETIQLTIDGEKNHLIFGATDWVYEEEFAFAKAFWWSPDGQKIAYLAFDESEVKEFTMMRYNDDMYPESETFKYPKVGEDNSSVYAFIYHLSNEETVPVELEDYEYIPRLTWTKDANQLCVFTMNRWQNDLKLHLSDATTGTTRLLLQEKNKYYIDIHDHLTFLQDGKHFIWTSEKSGYNHIYLYNMQGKEVRQITKGKWEVSKFYGIDEQNKKLFFQATEKSAITRYVYSIGLKKGKRKKLSPSKGWNDAQFSSTFSYFVNNHSTINQPNSYTVFDHKGNAIRVIEDNENLQKTMKKHQVQKVEFFEFETSDKVKLNGWMLKPDNFDENEMHPVFMVEYGGPGSQMAKDEWNAFDYWWYQMLVQNGYIVACVDNRGTGGRGEEFKKMTYLQLGKYETIDQIEAAKWLGKQSYVDKSRIGIFGWSYGGYLSSLCLLKGNDVFKSAIAVAPVTNWKWYDTIYTERYMRDTKENEKGYLENSPVYFADRLKGNYLLIHGMMDDNVHFQHAAEMAKAMITSNKQFDTYYYPNKNHGIYGGLTRLHLYTKMTNFIFDKL